LGLLASGFARPYLRHALELPASAKPGKNVMMLVDASASLRRANLWALAQARVDKVLKELIPADTAAIYVYDYTLHPVVGFEDWKKMPPTDRATLSAQLFKKETPGWGAGHMGTALIDAAQIMENWHRTGQRSEERAVDQIILISDMQEGSHLNGLQEYDWPKNIMVRVEPLSYGRIHNAGIQWLADREGEESSGAKPGVRLRVVNGIDSNKEQYRLWWDFGSAAGIKIDPVDIYVPSGQSKIVNLAFNTGSLTSERIRLSGDDEEYDNQVYVAAAEVEKLNISYFGDESEDDPQQSLFYLQRAVTNAGKRLVKIIHPAANMMTSSNLAECQIIIITSPLKNNQREVVKAVIQGGKTALLVLSSDRMGAELDAMLGKTLPVEETKQSGYAMLSQIDFAHPIFAPFADPRYNDFTKIRFWKHRRVDVTAIPEARVISRFDDNAPFLFQVPTGKGSLIVMTSGWHPEDSQLAVSSKFVPLISSIMEMSLQSKPARLQYQVGEVVSIPFDSSSGLTKVRRPDGALVDVTANDRRFFKTEIPGVYSILSSVATQRFAVNLPSEESKTSAILPEELKQLGVPLDTVGEWNTKHREAAQRERRAEEMEAQQSLWRWLILAALVVLLLETYFSGRIARRSAVETQ
jgi:hypothetical protein